MTNNQRRKPDFSIHRSHSKWMNFKLVAPAAAVLLASCSGHPCRVYPPDYAASAGATAVSRFDTNADGAIAGDELDGVPTLKSSIKQVDTDGDSRLTAQEIDARIQSWRDSRIAEMAVGCRVLLDGQPLPGAKLEFEPESFLGTDVRPAQATTDDSGSASVSMAADDLADPRYPGVACGWYRIRVTGSAHDLPQRYNTSTTLGCEIASNADWVHQPGEVLLELTTSKPGRASVSKTMNFVRKTRLTGSIMQ